MAPHFCDVSAATQSTDTALLKKTWGTRTLNDMSQFEAARLCEFELFERSRHPRKAYHSGSEAYTLHDELLSPRL